MCDVPPLLVGITLLYHNKSIRQTNSSIVVQKFEETKLTILNQTRRGGMLNTNNTLGNTNNEYFEFYFYNKKKSVKIKNITKNQSFMV